MVCMVCWDDLSTPDSKYSWVFDLLIWNKQRLSGDSQMCQESTHVGLHVNVGQYSCNISYRITL